MTKNKYYLLCLFFLGCVPKDGRLVIKNSCPDDIRYVITDTLSLQKLYDWESEKDTLLIKPDTYWNYTSNIPSNRSFSKLKDGMDGWVTFVNEAQDKKLRIFVFNEYILEKYSWKEIIYQNRYEKVIELSLQDLINCNWTVDLCKLR